MIEIKQLGIQPYREVWSAMKAFTEQRTSTTVDELWLLQHPAVYTQGLAGKAEHIHDAHGIEVIHIDRGGQVTYHAEGQVIVYLLLDIQRTPIGVRRLVTLIEQSVIDVLSIYGICGVARSDAPGVYVEGAKIASLGLKVRKGCTYHGLALNVDMDLTPFSYINPCGMRGLQVTQLKHFVQDVDVEVVASQLSASFIHLWTQHVERMRTQDTSASHL